MRPSFVNRKLPMLTTFITEAEKNDVIAVIRNAIYDGTDGIAIHLEALDKAYHNLEDLKRIYAYAEDKPIMSIHYRRQDRNETDEELINGQLLAIEAGATMCDIMGDMYDPSPLELSRKPKIIDKQKKLVERIHSLGGEVLMSSHTWVPMGVDETIEHAKALESRGADMIKIAMCAYTEDEMLEALKATALLKRELKVPYMHVCMGQYGKLHRAIAPMFGAAMALCVQSYRPSGQKEQPLLRAEKAVFDNIDWHTARDTLLGAKRGY